MNDKFLAKVLKIMDSWSVEDLEKKLLDFGIECERKVPCFSEQEIFDDLVEEDFLATLDFDMSNNFANDVCFRAANDDSYMMAA